MKTPFANNFDFNAAHQHKTNDNLKIPNANTSLAKDEVAASAKLENQDKNTLQLHIQSLKNTLKKCFDENDQLLGRITQLEALLSAAQDEIEQRDKAILELVKKLDSSQERSHQQYRRRINSQ